MEDHKWSKKVRVHKGALSRYGWHEHEGAEERHSALHRSVSAEGYAETIRRLTFIRNVANRSDNRRLHEVAEADEHWLEKERREGRA